LYVTRIKPISSLLGAPSGGEWCPRDVSGPDNTNAELPFGSSAILGSFVASVAACAGVAEEARTRGFATPAFAGLAFVEAWTLR
jgi:hypothetical protein